MNKEQVTQWVTNGPSKELINAASDFGQHLKEQKLNTSQIRQVFTKMKNIESKGLDQNRMGDLLMLKPFISYAAGRHRDVRGLQDLKQMVCNGIDCVADAKAEARHASFRNFVKLFEAVLAYHRAAGGI